MCDPKIFAYSLITERLPYLVSNLVLASPAVPWKENIARGRDLTLFWCFVFGSTVHSSHSSGCRHRKPSVMYVHREKKTKGERVGWWPFWLCS